MSKITFAEIESKQFRLELQVCYNATMNTHLELPADLEAVLQQIAAREKRDVKDVLQQKILE